MAIVVRFTPKSMSTAQYDEILSKLEAAGAGKPKGRLFGVAFGPHNALLVSDVWDSQENFDAFGQILMPILQEVGVDPGTPVIIEAYNTIPG